MIELKRDEINALFDEEEKAGREYILYDGQKEFDGLLYSVYVDTKRGAIYAVRATRCINMGFNSNDPGKVDEFIEIVEREGECQASWGVTGRTMHEILAYQLAKELPQYDFEIGYNYMCIGRKRGGLQE